MIKKSGHILLSFLLSLSLLFGGSAKEFIHLWAHHTDTVHDVHHVCPKGEAHFESEHHHCAFLGFVLAPFDGVSFKPSIHFFTRPATGHQYLGYQSVFSPGCRPHALFRGPPATDCFPVC
ncbi:MAG: hypothetical protein QM743_09875 [Chitinophagaceae bacterium]